MLRVEVSSVFATSFVSRFTFPNVWERAGTNEPDYSMNVLLHHRRRRPWLMVFGVSEVGLVLRLVLDVTHCVGQLFFLISSK